MTLFFIVPLIGKEKENDFRKVKWGMSETQVKKAEKVQLFYSKSWTRNSLKFTALAGTTKVSGLNCFLYYHFGENKLIYSSYVFNTSHSNSNNYIDDYKKIKDLLMKKYAVTILPSTLKETKVWYGREDVYGDSPEEYGFAISMGYLKFTSTLSTPTTNISLVLCGDNFEIHLYLFYLSLENMDLIKIFQEETDGL